NLTPLDVTTNVLFDNAYFFVKLRLDSGQEHRVVDGEKNETIDFTGRTMCVKRKLEGYHQQEHQSFALKRVATTVDSKDLRKLEGYHQQEHQSFALKRVATTVDSKALVSWGNQPLSVADPEIFMIMENEKLR
ncbi:hypothetical protein RYX36_011202, partial [Vicia faba]